MSLFPAYGDSSKTPTEVPKQTLVLDLIEDSTGSTDAETQNITEDQLLDSDSDVELVPAPPRPRTPPQTDSDDYYEDRKRDGANLGVSTLYLPGRPLYSYNEIPIGIKPKNKLSQHKTKRYYQAASKLVDVIPEPKSQLLDEVIVLEKGIRDDPHDERLWDKYIELQIQRGQAAMLDALDFAKAMKTGSSLVPRVMELSRMARSQADHMLYLRQLLVNERSPPLRSAIWCEILYTAMHHAAEVNAPDVDKMAAAATADLRTTAGYLNVLYLYGCFLSSAGLWEKLVTLIELLAAMNLSPVPVEPQQAQPDLTDIEDKLCNSGLPLDVVWRRVEKARASAHWRPHNCRDDMGADPQRSVQSADVADLLLPVVSSQDTFTLTVHILRWIGIPIIPPLLGSHYVPALLLHGLSTPLATSLGVSAASLLTCMLSRAELRVSGDHDEGFAPLLQMLTDPPHYFTDQYGYLSWVWSVCKAVTSPLTGGASVAALCWILRWCRALAMLAQDSKERDRICKQARQLLKSHNPPTAVAAAEYALVQAAGGNKGQKSQFEGQKGQFEAQKNNEDVPGGKLIIHAMRTALSDVETSIVDKIYVARIVGMIMGETSAVYRWSLVCAVLGNPLPTNLHTTPPSHLINAAYVQCEERCTTIEADISSTLEDGEHQLEAWRSFLPGEEQWAFVRTALEDRVMRDKRATWLQEHAEWLTRGNARSIRYHSALAVASRWTRAFLLLSDDITLAMMWGSQKVWERPPRQGGGGSRGAGAALASVLPALLRAARGHWQPALCESCARVCHRAGQGHLSPALVARAGGEAAGRAGRGAQGLMYAAVAAHPCDKWLYVSGSAWAGGWRDAADLLLEKQLRLHTLPDELAPL